MHVLRMERDADRVMKKLSSISCGASCIVKFPINKQTESDQQQSEGTVEQVSLESPLDKKNKKRGRRPLRKIFLLTVLRA